VDISVYVPKIFATKAGRHKEFTKENLKTISIYLGIRKICRLPYSIDMWSGTIALYAKAIA